LISVASTCFWRGEYLEFKKALLNAYQFKDHGELKWFLGIRIWDHANRRLWLCQDSYIDKLADSFKITAQLVKPSKHHFQLKTYCQMKARQHHKRSIYISITNWINHVRQTIIRPDAAWPSDKLAEFLLNPSPTHITATNRLITYLYNTRFYAIEHSYDRPDLSKPELAFRCVIDAAFADDTSTRRSTKAHFYAIWRSH